VTQIDIDQQTLVKNSVLIPVAFVAGTLIAIAAYSMLPPTVALATIFGGAIVVSLITYMLVKSKME
jgi:hypothetical protein